MSGIKTHYDNLKVARNAPPEVIRSAYKALSSKYHPDKNPGNPTAERIMKLVNRAYEVLSDPVKRRQHDIWIERMERVEVANLQMGIESEGTRRKKSGPRYLERIIKSIGSSLWDILRVLAFTFKLIIIIAVFAGIINYSITWLIAPDESPVREIDAAESSSEGSINNGVWCAPAPSPQATATTEPDFRLAPNGFPWPAKAGYLEGYEILNRAGLSSITIDNSRNGADVFVKLVVCDDRKLKVARQLFIPAYGVFTLDRVTAGAYDIRGLDHRLVQNRVFR
ncbi:J domain-containing protein [Thiocapsa rosea]|uniref:DnaJ-like protein n=1 Tax=Thiocapsa rosea TaxID=69360 RepID=A0A495VEJ8_9GAMM|nr:J domain-containing protein [Thiocapsa rosea]RKT46807.1 DnaJ-like protein [Thiocapsa rosea]